MASSQAETGMGLPYYVERIVAATGNRHKLAELSNVGRDFGLTIVSPAEICQANCLSLPPEVEENGATYEENALLKAKAYAAWSGCVCLGDDSGLEVTALENRPGVMSARYAGKNAENSARIAKVLCELKEVWAARGSNDRTARFRCALCLAYPNGAVLCAEGTLSGQVLFQPQGAGGFGYDPIILIDSLGKTLAEVDFSITCKHGFRAQAAQKLFSSLLQLRGQSG